MNIQSFLESLNFDNDDFENYSDFFRVKRVSDEKPPGNDDCEILLTTAVNFTGSLVNIFAGKANDSGKIFSTNGDTLVTDYQYWTPIDGNPIFEWHNYSDELPKGFENVICEITPDGGNYKYIASFYEPGHGFVYLKGAEVKSWCYIPNLREEFESYESE